MVPNIDPAVVAMLPAGTLLTFQVEAGALVHALTSHQGGPDELSTRTAAQFIGRNSKWWREHAPKINEYWLRKEGAVGAYLDESENWRLVNAAARDYLAAHGRRDVTAHPDTRKRRGPRRKQAAGAPAQ